MSERTYEELRQVIVEQGKFVVDGDRYRGDLRKAAEQSFQKYHGSHGLRWSFAQARFQEVQRDEGLTYEQTLVLVSAEMGHNRGDITEHYSR